MTSSDDRSITQPDGGADPVAVVAGRRHPDDAEWQAALAALPGYLVVADRQRRIQLLNQPPLGRSAHDFRGADFADFVVAEHRKLVVDAVDEVLAGAPARELESRSAISGRWFRSRIVGVVEQGVVTGLMVHVLDIEDAKQAESELARLRAQVQGQTPAGGVEAQGYDHNFAMMADALPMLLSYVDASGRYQYNNRAYGQWFGTPHTALRGQHVSAVLGPDYEQVKPHIDDALRGLATSYETIIAPPGSGMRRVSVHLIPVSNRQGQPSGFYGLVQDITQRYRIEAALRQREDELRQMQKIEALGRLSAGMAHEFNNLLQ
ncbi:MAG: PAS domain-containing protein, partial [Pseudomonadales bacterium]